MKTSENTKRPAGIGNDIVEIERIRACFNEHGQRFLERIFTPKEQEYCLRYKDAAIHIAGRFAAKEAIAKALGVGIGKTVSWQDIEVTNDATGKPSVVLSSRIKIVFSDPHVLVSISHCRLYATAVALIQ